MTDKEKAAQEYEENAECIEVDDYGHKVYGCLEIEQAWLAGFEAGKPQWHDLREDPTDLPNCEHGHTVFNQDLDRVIIRNGRFEHLDGHPVKVIAWCEIQKYTEE